MARQAAAFEVGARPFAAMVEEAEVVVFAFERLDFALDELVQFGKVRNIPEASCTLIEQNGGTPGPRPEYANRTPSNKPCANGACSCRFGVAIRGLFSGGILESTGRIIRPTMAKYGSSRWR
jgi:hypothetical protein